MNTFRYIIVIIALAVMGNAHARDFATFDVSLYAADQDDFSGFMVGTTIGTEWLAQINLVSSENLGGLSLAFGRDFGQFDVFLGAMVGSDLERVRREIDVNGVDTFGQDTPEFTNPPLFIEFHHDSGWFVRYTKYTAEYTIEARRFELIDPGPPPEFDRFDASEDFEIDDNVLFVGYRTQF